jgi:hypothetical protein
MTLSTMIETGHLLFGELMETDPSDLLNWFARFARNVGCLADTFSLFVSVADNPDIRRSKLVG